MANFKGISVKPEDYKEYEETLELLRNSSGIKDLKMPQAIKKAMGLLRELLENDGQVDLAEDKG